ncbi:MAG: type II secretion system protein [Candidatus Ratteibacteria bacterium]|nr:type II secretion system protein [Candidatus Ratteibacteria bacterium]
MRDNDVLNKLKKIKGFTLMELLVVIAIIGMLSAVILPALARMREGGRRARCISNLRQLMLCEAMYADNWNQFLPGPRAIVGATDAELPHPESAAWLTCEGAHLGLLALEGYITEPKFWMCPSAQASNPLTGTGEHRTYDYTVSIATFRKPWPYDLVAAGPWQDMYDYDLQFNDLSLKLPGDHRKITTFPDPSNTVIFAEENTGMVSLGECGGSTVVVPADQVINDPLFCYNDLTEPRHLETSVAGCLDGSVITIYNTTNNCENIVYKYGENGPKMIHLMPEYSPYIGWKRRVE